MTQRRTPHFERPKRGKRYQHYAYFVYYRDGRRKESWRFCSQQSAMAEVKRLVREGEIPEFQAPALMIQVPGVGFPLSDKDVNPCLVAWCKGFNKRLAAEPVIPPAIIRAYEQTVH